MLFLLLISQKALAPLVWLLEPFKYAYTGHIVFLAVFFRILHHNSFIFYPISNIKKAKFAEISALSFTNWSKSASSFSLESRTNRRRQGAAVEFSPYFSGQFPAKI